MRPALRPNADLCVKIFDKRKLKLKLYKYRIINHINLTITKNQDFRKFYRNSKDFTNNSPSLQKISKISRRLSKFQIEEEQEGTVTREAHYLFLS